MNALQFLCRFSALLADAVSAGLTVETIAEIMASQFDEQSKFVSGIGRAIAPVMREYAERLRTPVRPA